MSANVIKFGALSKTNKSSIAQFPYCHHVRQWSVYVALSLFILFEVVIF